MRSLGAVTAVVWVLLIAPHLPPFHSGNKRAEILALAKPVGQAPHTSNGNPFSFATPQIIVAGFGSARPIHQHQIFISPPSLAESRIACDMRLCLPARMGGGGKPNRCPGAGQRAKRPPHGGDYSGLGNERAKPLAFPLTGIARIQHKQRHPCTARRRRMACARNRAPAPLRQGERQECQRVSSKTPHPQERAARDRVRPNIPAQFPCSRSSPGWAETTGPVRAAHRAGRP